MLWALLAVVAAFGVGFFWQWFEARDVREDLARTEHELRVERLRVDLARASMAAQAGEYEEARSLMSDFFTRLQDQQSELHPDLARAAEAMLTRRDEVITGLSRSNPAYAGILRRMLSELSTAAGERAPPIEQGVPDTPAVPAVEPGAVEGAADTVG